MRRWLAVAALLIAARSARADEPDCALHAEPARATEPSTLRRIAAVSAALVPGVVVRGAGSFVVGERRTAKRLLLTAGSGAALAAVGGIAVGATRANSYFVWPGVPIALAGVGIVLPTWFADIWVAAGGDRITSGPRGAPPWSLELGTTWLHDGIRGERALLRAGATLELGRLGLGAGALLDAEGAAQTGELEARWRIRGAAAANGPIDDGSRLVVRAAARLHRDDADNVTLATGELELVLRGELRRIDPVLRGQFVELSSGLGLERATYARGVDELDAILLGRFAWGVYLGHRGEAMLFYDHRRDHLAGGLYSGPVSGFIGSVGAAAQVAVAGPWALRAELEIGTAWVTTLGLRYHGGK